MVVDEVVVLLGFTVVVVRFVVVDGGMGIGLLRALTSSP